MIDDVVTIPITLLTRKDVTADDIVTYAMIKAHLPLSNHTVSVERLRRLGLVKTKKVSKPTSMDAVKRSVKVLAKTDKRPYLIRLALIKQVLLETGKEATIQVLVYGLKKRIEDKINRDGKKMLFSLSDDWVKENTMAALALYKKYPYRAERWEQVLTFFFEDEFWRDVITSVKLVGKHLHRYLLWESKTTPTKVKRTLNIIGE